MLFLTDNTGHIYNSPGQIPKHEVEKIKKQQKWEEIEKNRWKNMAKIDKVSYKLPPNALWMVTSSPGAAAAYKRGDMDAVKQHVGFHSDIISSVAPFPGSNAGVVGLGYKTRKWIAPLAVGLTAAELTRRELKKDVAEEGSDIEKNIGDVTRNFPNWVERETKGEYNKAVLKRNKLYDKYNTKHDYYYKSGSSLKDENRDGRHDIENLTISIKEMNKQMGKGGKNENQDFIATNQYINYYKDKYNKSFPNEPKQDTLESKGYPEWPYKKPLLKK